VRQREREGAEKTIKIFLLTIENKKKKVEKKERV
jgi:hypothetical protein